MRKIIASIDLGSDTIKIIVGEIYNNKLNILAISDTPSKGIKKGLVVNPNEMINCLKKGLKKIEESLDLKVKKAIINVSAIDANFISSEGTCTINNADGIVRGTDIVRALQASTYNKVALNKELINVIPVDYILDDEQRVINPKGLKANKIVARSILITTPKKNIYNVLSCFDKLGIEIIDISVGSIGDYETFKNNKISNSIGAIINMGSNTTTISIFNKGIMTNSEVIELGSENIDNDISFIYKINKVESKRLKENLALGHKRLASATVSEEIKNKLGDIIKINQYEISEIVMSRIAEILNKVKKEINYLTKHEISYIIFTGGLTEITDLSLLLEEIFGKNVTLGKIDIIGARNRKYSSAIGMIKYFNNKLKLRDKEFSIFDFEELEYLSSANKKMNISNDTIFGKIFGYFFDN